MKFKPKSFILYLAKSSCLLFLIVMLISCRGREVEIPIDFEGERLVLLAKLEAGKPARVEVSKTFPPTGLIPENRSVNNAQVSLYKNGVFYANLKSLNNTGLYGADSLIEAGQEYSLKVEAASFPTAESEKVTVPLPISALNFSRFRNAEPEINPMFQQDRISLLFGDAKNLQTSYIFCGFYASYSTHNAGGAYFSKSNLSLYEEECHIFENTFNQRYAYPLLLNGSCIQANKPVIFFVRSAINNVTTGQIMHANRIVMLLASVTKEWYAYNQVANKQPDGLDLLVLSPQMAYTNVKNGYGIVYGINGKEIEIK